VAEQWFLSHVDVQGHVGIGEVTVSLELVPTPGVTVITAPNGTGKTSIVDGIRRCLGNDSRTDEVLEGNLHYDVRNIDVTVTDRTRIAHLRCSGNSTASWHEGADGASAIPSNWSRAYSRYQPVLLYPEIARIITEPGNLHDFLKTAISVDVLQELQRRIGDQRTKSRTYATTLAKLRTAAADLLAGEAYAEVKALVAACAEVPTASQRSAVAAALTGLATQTSRVVPEIVEVAALPVYAESTATRVESFVAAKEGVVSGTEVLRDVLRKLRDPGDALAEARTADRCPVCGATGQGWDQVAQEQEQVLTKLLSAYDKAKLALEARLKSIIGVLPKAPAVLDTLTAVGDLEDDVTDLKGRWELVWGSAAGLKVDELTVASIDALVESIARIRKDRDALAVRLDVLRSAQSGQDALIKVAVDAWLENADDAKDEIGRRDPADKLKNWVDGQIKSTRDLLFQPISDGAKEIWSFLNPESDLDLTGLGIAGGTERQQKILPGLEIGGVTVPASTEGVRVLSTGQRNALSLATYLPRSAQLASPFRFLVLDDPIQAFDGSRVSYLAARLSEIAKTHQVLVFTHDERLWDDLCALSANARRVVLRRRADGKSQVEVIEATSAGNVLLAELAKTLAIYEQGNPSGATEEAVTALTLAVCRQALDAELVQQLGILGRRAGKAPDLISDDVDKSSKTRDRLGVWSTYCTDCGLSKPDYSSYDSTINALNQGSHGQAPQGVTQPERQQWLGDSSKLIAMVASDSTQVST
jgi:ABC-type uncharacterized transport system ATPase subunit